MSSPALPSRRARLALYANMLRVSRSFTSYNFRSYFLRNTRAKFRLAAAETDPQRIQSTYDGFVAELQTLRRAATVNRLFEGSKLVVEQTRIRPGSGGTGMGAGAGHSV
jgi:LYR motif-containing protein 4